MSSWPAALLPDVAQIIMGQSPPGDTYNETGNGLPFFQGKAEFGDVSPTPKKWCTAPKKIAQSGDILISVRAPVGPTNLAATQCCIGRGLAAIRANPELLDPTYLRFALRQAEQRIASMGQGSTFAAIGRAELASVGFPLPLLDEQRRIVDLLSRAESIVRLRREAQKKITELISSLFLDMFGDPATNPKGWAVARIGDLGRVQLGRQRAPKYQTGVHTRPYVRVANVFEDRIDISDVLSMDFDDKDFAQYRLEFGDILLNEGQSTELVGRPAMWRDEIHDCCFQNTLVRFQPNRTQMIPEFALTALLHYYRSGVLSQISSKTSNVAHLGAARFANLPLYYPPFDLQSEFAYHFEQIRSIQSQQAAATLKAEATFDALLAKTFVTSDSWPSGEYVT